MAETSKDFWKFSEKFEINFKNVGIMLVKSGKHSQNFGGNFEKMITELQTPILTKFTWNFVKIDSKSFSENFGGTLKKFQETIMCFIKT